MLAITDGRIFVQRQQVGRLAGASQGDRFIHRGLNAIAMQSIRAGARRSTVYDGPNGKPVARSETF